MHQKVTLTALGTSIEMVVNQPEEVDSAIITRLEKSVGIEIRSLVELRNSTHDALLRIADERELWPLLEQGSVDTYNPTFFTIMFEMSLVVNRARYIQPLFSPLDFDQIAKCVKGFAVPSCTCQVPGMRTEESIRRFYTCKMTSAEQVERKVEEQLKDDRLSTILYLLAHLRMSSVMAALDDVVLGRSYLRAFV